MHVYLLYYQYQVIMPSFHCSLDKQVFLMIIFYTDVTLRKNL